MEISLLVEAAGTFSFDGRSAAPLGADKRDLVGTLVGRLVATLVGTFPRLTSSTLLAGDMLLRSVAAETLSVELEFRGCILGTEGFASRTGGRILDNML